ncbi:MAG: hypothetical protein EHM70_14555 [Chloroflexota bacterium]|nr:MAG: hypothetical protein EHM70_14555 [Chloroflexota bacterium]
MKHYLDQMPLYIAGQLDSAELSELEKHLSRCPACQEELNFWRTLAGEIIASGSHVAAPADLAESALVHLRLEASISRNNKSPFVSWRFNSTILRTLSLLRAQVYLIKREMWPTSAAIMALGVIVAVLSNHIEAITFIAPLVAAATQAMLYGPEHDPAHELALSTPTSQWKILLARLSVVSAYNLLLALLSSLAILLIIPPKLLGMITLGWLAPMAFLSALALLLSLWIGTGNAVTLAYGLWILQFLQISKILENWGYSSSWDAFLNVYKSFWQSPGLLFLLSLVLVIIALLSTRYAEWSGRSIVFTFRS